MKQKKIKLNIKKLLLRLSFIAVFIFGYLFVKYRFIIMGTAFSKMPDENNLINNSTIDTNITQTQISNYKIIVEEKNPNYNGIGQKKVTDKTGYYTTFTLENGKTYNEYKQNGNTPWANNPYWDNTMETDGCGITAMSIILSAYGRKHTPEDLRQQYYPYLLSDNISNELSNSFGISNSGFYYDSIHLSAESLEQHLKTNRPILICVWNQPENNRWTTVSHYMLLLATDNSGKVYISNPNGLENSYNSSGWYNIDEISPYIAKALYILQK